MLGIHTISAERSACMADGQFCLLNHKPVPLSLLCWNPNYPILLSPKYLQSGVPHIWNINLKLSGLTTFRCVSCFWLCAPVLFALFSPSSTNEDFENPGIMYLEVCNGKTLNATNRIFLFFLMIWPIFKQKIKCHNCFCIRSHNRHSLRICPINATVTDPPV